MPNYLKICLFLLVVVSCNRRPTTMSLIEVTPYLNIPTNEIDSLLNVMSLEEKVGQLIIFQPDFSEGCVQEPLNQLVSQNKLGGLILKDLPISEYAELSDSLKIASKLPLFFATDEEITLHNQFTDLPHFPKLISLDAIDSTELIQQLETHYLDQCKALGINICLTPTLQQSDISKQKQENFGYDFQNPNINRNAIRRIARLQENRILSIGDSFADLHYLEQDTTGKLDSLLFPYRTPIAAGLGGILIDETILSIDTIKELPTYFVKNYLSDHLDFRGLIISKHSEKDSFEKLFHAGTDVYVTKNFYDTFNFLLAFAKQGILTKTDLNEKVRKVLQAKTWVNNGYLLPHQEVKKESKVAAVHLIRKEMPREAPSDNLIGGKKQALIDYFKNPSWQYFSRYLFEKSIIIANNHEDLIPYKNTIGEDFRILYFGKQYIREFEKYFKKYAFFSHQLFKTKGGESLEAIPAESFKYSKPILVLEDLKLDSVDNQEFIRSINELAKLTPTTLINFGNADNLAFFDSTLTIIQIFEANKTTQSLAAQLLFGGIEGEGKMPNTVSDKIVAGSSNPIQSTRIKYTSPEEVGIAKARLSGIDAIMHTAMREHAAPGGQIVIAKEGKIIYSKAFGHHTYQGKQLVHKNDLYDLASLTKPGATTLMGMKLYEQKRINLTDPIKKTSKMFEGKSIGWIRLRDLFTHKSGLQSYMPIAKYISRRDTTHSMCNNYFCTEDRDSFSVKITNELYFHEKYRKKIRNDVLNLKKDRRRRSFRYSDVNFYLIQQILEEQANQRLDDYVQENFYRPLGLRHTRFNPLEEFSKYQIAPTQEDIYWRKTLVQGTVHDETAALMGGVAGNAGLFSTAEEVAVLFQMLLNGGHYGGVQYFEEETVKFFTSSGHGNHRGLGFDKPSPRKVLPYAKSVSKEAFGHTGFTGGCVWADPKDDLVFVFLNNRVHPNVKNRTLAKKRTRSRIHQVVYDALDSFNFGLPKLDLEGKNG